MAADLERPADAGAGEAGRVRRWKRELELAHREERAWRERAAKVVERYRDDERMAGTRFNILWSNIETLKPAIYSQTPSPDVRRRYLDADPAGRQAAEVIERALSYAIDDYDFDGTMEAVRDDMLLTGRGAARVVYEPTIERLTPEPIVALDPVTMMPTLTGYQLDGQPVAPEIDEDGAPYVERITYQTVRCEHVYWRDLRLAPSRSWREVRWIAFRHVMSRDDLERDFGVAVAAAVQLTVADGERREETHRDETADIFKRAEVWEIWDKPGRRRVYVSNGLEDRFLREEDDPLGLDGFFPMPEPLYGSRTTDRMVPIPEYTIYQDQARELDEVSTRISKLVSALKVRGFYAGVLKEMSDLLAGEENELHPIDDWNAIGQLGGLDKAIALLPIGQIAQVLAGLYQHREQLKQTIYEITGISDIIRGATNAGETATAQRLKGNFGTFRMTPRQKPMQRFIRDLLRLKAEIVAEHFEPDILARMTGMEIGPDVINLLRDQALREFRIDIETDSTVQPDAQAEQAAAVEFSQAVTNYLRGALEIVAAAPESVELVFDILKATVRQFKAGREVEDTIDRTAEAVAVRMQAAQNQPPQPDPEIARQTQAMQIDAAKARQDMEIDAAKANADLARRALGIVR